MSKNETADTFAFSALVAARDVTIRIDCEPERGTQRASDPCRVIAKCKLGNVPYGYEESLSMRDPRTIGQVIDEVLRRLMALCDRDGEPRTKEVATDIDAQLRFNFIRDSGVAFEVVYDRPRGRLIARVSCRGRVEGMRDVSEEYVYRNDQAGIGDGFARALQRLMKVVLSNEKDS